MIFPHFPPLGIVLISLPPWSIREPFQEAQHFPGTFTELGYGTTNADAGWESVWKGGLRNLIEKAIN